MSVTQPPSNNAEVMDVKTARETFPTRR
jgi:hypothetical protein